MKVLIAGGAGFLGQRLAKSLVSENHQVWVLTRNTGQQLPGVTSVLWDGKTTRGWGPLVNEMDAIVNLCGLSLFNWPWTKSKKQRFLNSRVEPGRALVSAVEQADHRPSVFFQMSGINHYGLRGEEIADENSAPGEDYLSQLTVAWEESTVRVSDLGVRRVVCRTAVVLARDAVLFWMMALPVRLFFGGPFGNGRQALPWIHIEDVFGAMKFLLDNSDLSGVYNLIALQQTSNAEFMQTLAAAYERPYWFPVPAFLMRMALGEMSVLITAGRYARPRNLLRAGYKFQFPELSSALSNLVMKK
jgi:uncharacterized protein (TIGR01777 family)